MKKIFKNKLLIILVLITLFITSMCSSVFASTVDFGCEQVELPSYFDNYYYFTYYSREYDGDDYRARVVIFLNNEPFTVSLDNGNPPIYSFNSVSGEVNGFFIRDNVYNRSFSSFLPDTEPTSFSNSGYVSSAWLDNSSSIGCYFCNFDIEDEQGNVVFQKAPQVQVPEVPEITQTLVEQTTQAQIQEQLAMMITGFLKYLLALLVSVIAFWKGWKFLSSQFRKA